IHVQHVGPVEEVEHLNTGFSLDAFGERNLSLQAHIEVIERIALEELRALVPTRSGKGNPSPLVSNPALMLNQRALCRLLSSENLKSRTTIGHSFGDSVKNANVKRWRTSLSPSARSNSGCR